MLLSPSSSLRSVTGSRAGKERKGEKGREREREREKKIERERERKKKIERERERITSTNILRDRMLVYTHTHV